MSAADDIADSTDWLNTPLAGLAPLESGLRCQVCKDFFTTPMITSCSHTFCSLCIRRYLSQEGRCPACRESDQEMKLRRNWAVEELVEHFKQCRGDVLAFARRPSSEEREDLARPKKRRKVETSTATATATQRRSTRSQSRKVAASASQVSQESTSTQEEVADSNDEGSVYQDEIPQRQQQIQPPTEGTGPNDGLVVCPICNRRMKEANINPHLDRCTQGLPTSPTPPPSTHPTRNGASATPTLAYSQRTKLPAPAQKDRLPTINYSLYTETSLRKKLKELGIPSHGNKELMRKRHTEWMNLWNANCDSSRPKQKRELLRELDTWERTLGRQLERGANSASTGVMVKDFDREGWVQSHNDDFVDLIKKAREKRKAVAASSNDQKEENRSVNTSNDVKMAGIPESATIRMDDQHQQQERDQQQDTPDATVQTTNTSEQVDNNNRGELSVTKAGDTRPEGPNGVTGLDTQRHDTISTADSALPSPNDMTTTPQTPRKADSGEAQAPTPIDLASSPTFGSPSQQAQTPGKRRSRFFD